MTPKSRVLIVDDTPVNIKILADLLRSDYTLSVATCGAEALEIAASEERPDLILLDVMMPEMDGHEVCRRLKADPQTTQIPIIFVTAMSETDDETRGFELGGVDYITKPVRPPIVKARVAAQLELAMSRRKLAEQNRNLLESLRIAGDVQRGLLPRHPPEAPGLDVAGCVIPCDAVGGDYLDYLQGAEFSGRGLGVVVGDISGHGPGAALVMAAARALLRMCARQPGTLGEIVGELNRRLNADLGDSWRFMTLFLLAIDAGRLAWVSAGHDPALLIDPTTGTIEELLGEGPPVGLFPEEKYEARNSALLLPNQVLVLTTDGIPETFGPEGQQYGQERFRESLLRHANLGSQAMVDAVLADMLHFRGEAPQTDDLTIVVVRRTA